MNRTHRVTLALTIALFVTTCIVMIASAAHAEGRHADARPWCTTKGEWSRLHIGQTRETVEEIMDGRGHYAWKSRLWTYEVCNTRPGDALIALAYRDGLLWQAIRFDFSDVNR